MNFENSLRIITDAFNRKFSRKGFLKLLGVGVFALAAASRKAGKAFAASSKTLTPRVPRKVTTAYDLAVVKSNNPEYAVRQAVEELGGIKAFVQKRDIVVIKPNIGWDRTPEQAGNTNPIIVQTLVTMCREARAKKVNVFDRTCNDQQFTYKRSGIYDAVKKAKGNIYYTNEYKFYPGVFPEGSSMQEWPIYRDAVQCDCFINVPIAKHHGLAELTLSMKNLMGVCGGRRGSMHENINQNLTELTAFIKPDLTIIDAYRILLRHGPQGGSLDDVAMKYTVIASTDPVLADAYAVTLFDKKPADIGHIALAAKKGIGSMDIAKAKVKLINAL